MKLNKILMALSAMAIVGCSSEDFNDPSATQAIDDSRLIQLDENFVLAGVGEVDNTTRTHWEQDGKNLVNKFLPVFKTGAVSGQLLSVGANLEAQAVGLCWLGNGAAGTDVYTNYEFYHFGWLKKDETKAEIECDKLTNGVLYDEITLKGTVTADKEADETTNFTLPTTPVDKSAWTLNYNSGVYKTENKAIFGGQYIVYYPYNKDFKDAGTIPAKAKTSFDWDITAVPTNPWEAPELGAATFRYSAPVTIKGGDKAADFGLKNLSTLVRLRVSTVTGDANIGDAIDQIVLYSKSGKLLKQANLAADKIAAGKEGAELYAETEGTKTITTNFINAIPALDTKASTAVSAYITVLPTTVDDLVALVHNSTDGKWAKVEMPTTEFKAGAAQVLDITVKDADFKSEYIAVDYASLVTALGEARLALGTSTTAKKEITVIGDIKLTGYLGIDQTDLNGTSAPNSVKDTQITIKGDDIIVPEDQILTLATNMESNVRVLGKSCCSGNAGGILNIAGGTINNVTMEKTEATKPDNNDNPTLNYYGAATVAAGKTIDVKAGIVEVYGAVAHKGDIKIAKGAKLTVYAYGDLQFMGSNVTNNGTIEVMKDGKFDMTNSQGNATATDGKRMTNNGKFIHNVDAGVGTAVQSMVQNGEYRCKVDDQIKLDDAFLQWTACSVIEMVNAAPTEGYNLGTAKGITPAAYKHNGKYIDIEVNTTSSTTFNNKTADNEVIQIGNLTVKNGGLDIDYTNKVGTTTGKRTLTVNGDMAVKANTTITDSKLIDVKGNVTVEGDGVNPAWNVSLYYKGEKKNEGGFKVAGDITVSGATFKAGNIYGGTAADVDALNITCANFYLKKIGNNIGGVAEFANRTDGAAKNMSVDGTIDNPAGCEFNIQAAGQYNGSVLAWVSCKELKVGGTFTGARPRVVE